MNKNDYNTYYLQFERKSADGTYTTKYVSEEEFNECDFGAIFYVQKPTGLIYCYTHEYKFHLVFYKGGLPTVVEENLWNVGPTIHGWFMNLSNYFRNPNGLTFNMSFVIVRNNSSNDRNFVYNEEFVQSGEMFQGMMKRISEVPALIMDIIHKESTDHLT